MRPRPIPAKVLFLDTGIFTGPVFSVYRSIIRSLDRERFEPLVAVDVGMKGPLLDDIAATRWTLGLELRLAPRTAPGTPSGKGLSRLLAGTAGGTLGLARWIRQNDISIVHCSQETACSLIGIALGAQTGARVVVHQHSAPDRGGPLPLRRLAIDLAHANVGVSAFICDSVLRHSLRKRPVDLVSNGVDVERFRPDVDGSAVRAEYGVRADEILLVQLGRFEPYKRQEDFARAFVLAKRQVPKLRGLIIGWEDARYNGENRRRIDQLCREAGLGDALRTDDARADPWRVHAAADAFVMPAVDEPFGLVVAEAMASAKPVIAVRSGALPEIVADGQTGVIVEPRSPEELARAFVLLSRDLELRKRMGALGRRRAVTLFSDDRLGRDFGEVYARLSSSSGGPVRDVSPLHARRPLQDLAQALPTGTG
jgi:glycosyltransferase involved in cell wall biosynthesis